MNSFFYKLAHYFFNIYEKKIRKIHFGVLKNFKIYSILIFSQVLGFYEKKIFSIVKNLARDTDTSSTSSDRKSAFINLGANNGYTSLSLSKILPNAIIFSCEANKILCKDFNFTIKLNKILNIINLPYAISYKKNLFNYKKDGMFEKSMNLKIEKNFSKYNKFLNNSISFNELLKKIKINKFNNIGLFIDIESFEIDILLNEKIEIFNKFYLIIIECHSSEILKKYIKYLDLKKFVIKKKFIDKKSKKLQVQIIPNNHHNSTLIIYNKNLKIN
jgi:FkbM family methyltransferase